MRIGSVVFVLFLWKLFYIQVKGCLSRSVQSVKNNDDNDKIKVMIIRMIMNAASGKSVKVLL